MAISTVIPSNNKRFAEVIEFCNKYSSRVFYNNPIKSEIIYDLPFKIRVMNIKIPGYGPNNPPPVGLAIIGINNYIL